MGRDPDNIAQEEHPVDFTDMNDPEQYEQRELIEFAAQMLARRRYETSGHPGISWERWLGDPGDLEGRLVPYRRDAENLASLGMLAWPEDTPGVLWAVVERDHDDATDPAYESLTPFSTRPRAAVRHLRGCRKEGRTRQLKWWFVPSNDEAMR